MHSVAATLIRACLRRDPDDEADHGQRGAQSPSAQPRSAMSNASGRFICSPHQFRITRLLVRRIGDRRCAKIQLTSSKVDATIAVRG